MSDAPAIAPEQPRASRGTVVVDLDSSYVTSEASGWAGRLAMRLGTPVTAVRTWHPGLGEVREGAHDVARRRRQVELATWAEPARLAGAELHLDVVEDEPTGALCQTVSRLSGSTVVLGIDVDSWSHRHETARLASRLLGSTRTPTVVVPLAGAARPVDRVLVGLDGSPSSLAASRWVAALGSVQTRAVAVVEPLVEWVPADDPASIWSELEAGLNGPWTAALRAAGIDVATKVHSGPSAMHVLTELAHRGHSDLIVVGAGERGRPGAFGVRLARHARLPVAIVPSEKPLR
jgi:nucleotide-binding universal stress UspA family protein